jgi:hypothetical protein
MRVGVEQVIEPVPVIFGIGGYKFCVMVTTVVVMQKLLLSLTESVYVPATVCVTATVGFTIEVNVGPTNVPGTPGYVHV